MGYVILVLGAAGMLGDDAAGRAVAVTGVTQMVSHGLLTGALFLLTGVMWDRRRTDEMNEYGGVAGPAPRFAALLALAAFGSLGLPGFSGFIGEFQIFAGSLGPAPVATVIAVLGILVTAGLFLWALQRILLGPRSDTGFADLRRHETAAIAPLMGLAIVVGLLPAWLLASSNPRPEPSSTCSPHDNDPGRLRAVRSCCALPDGADLMNERPLALLPELLLLGGAVSGLVLGLFLPRRRQWIVRLVAAGTLVAVLVASAIAARQLVGPVFDGAYAVDVPLTVARIVVCAATLLVLALPGRSVVGHLRETEFYTLLLLAALGTIALAGAADLLLLVAAYLLASVPLYALAGFAKDAAGTEAALKYYLMGALFGVALLVRVTLLFGAGGGTGYVELASSLPRAPRVAVAVGGLAVLAGLAFKLGAVPAHFWVPDVTEGASTPVAAFVTTVPKVGARCWRRTGCWPDRSSAHRETGRCSSRSWRRQA